MLARGTRLGPYEILDPIGRGGMGEVYRGRDTRLARSVAMKVLAAGEGRSTESRERFAREARAIAALDHPHICTLYDVGEQDGVDYLVMPLLDGETLAARLARRPLPLAQALPIALQIADALDRAHRAGFVHRDLKPGNIMLVAAPSSEAGVPQVKLLDFGLAKLTAPPTSGAVSAVSTLTAGVPGLTESGAIVGTPQYMAPEQVEGKAVDSRTDLFAFGAVLHEMLSGRRAFEGGSAAGVIAAILERQPPALSTLQPDVPPALDAIVRRCLAKSPDARFQSAADLRFAIESLTLPTGLSAATATSAATIARNRWRVPILLVAAVLLAGAGWLLRSRATSESTGVPNLLNPLQVTNAIGVEDYPSWSPDGRTLAYAANPLGEPDSGNWDIWVAQVGGTEPLNRTPESVADDRFPAWSPDGKQIAFWSDRDGGGCYVMSALAGGARKVAAASPLDPNPPAWSADGRQLACVTLDGSDVFAEIHDLGGALVRRMLLPGAAHQRRVFLSWSPDQKAFAYSDTAAGLTADTSQLWILRLSDGRTFPITDGRSRTMSASWSPTGDAVYFVSNLGGAMDLWRQAVSSDSEPSGSPARVTSGIGMRSARLSSDGSRLAYSQGRRVANIWRLPIFDDRVASWADGRQITFDQAFVESFDLSPDGTRLLVTSDRAGNPDIWSLPSDGGEMRQVVADPAPDFFPRWSPDGRTIAFISIRSGNRDLWLIPFDGGAARRLTDSPATDTSPSWSPDGQSIAFLSDRADGAGVWIVPAAGGAPRQVPTSAPRLGGRWSPDGRWLLAPNSSFTELFLLSADLSGREVGVAQQARAGVWSRDSRRVYFSGAGPRAQRLFVVSTDGTGERLVADLTGRRGTLGDFGTDGRSLYFTWEEGLGDIWVMDVLPGRR